MQDGVLTPSGEPGPAAARWMAAGFARVRLDLPGSMALYTSGTGFRVHCPVDGGPITPAFTAAMTAFRSGSGRWLSCPSCGRRHPLEALVGHPPFALGSLALVTVDAMALTVQAEALRWIEAAMGPVRTVLRRG